MKDLVATLRLVENPRDELAWFRILGVGRRRGAATARRQAAAATAGTTPTVAPDLVAALADARALAGAGGDDQRPGAALESQRDRAVVVL